MSHESLIKDIDVSKDILDDFDENINDDRVGDGDGKDNNSKSGKGVYDYNVDDL